MTCDCSKYELVWCRVCWRWEPVDDPGPRRRAPFKRRVRRLLAWPFSLANGLWWAVWLTVRGPGSGARSGVRFWLARVLWHISGIATFVWLTVLGDDVGPACPPPAGYYQPNSYPYAYPDKHRECEAAQKHCRTTVG